MKMSARDRPVAAAAALVSLTAAMFMAQPAHAQSRMTVTAEENLRRTCPSIECGIVGRFYPGESVIVHDSVDGWSRVSLYYSAGCSGGRSAFVDSGRDTCTPENGIENGEFAEWVRSDFLAAGKAKQPG